MHDVLLDDRSWDLPRDFDPPKPLRGAQIARLGDTLDEFEGVPPWRIARYDAEVEYLVAVRDRTWAEIRKFERLKRAPSFRDGQRMRAEIIEAQCQLDNAVTAREICDARAALELARCRFEISQRKYRQARRQAKADERAGKNIVTLRGIAFRRNK
jgi:hypothetical protein